MRSAQGLQQDVVVLVRTAKGLLVQGVHAWAGLCQVRHQFLAFCKRVGIVTGEDFGLFFVWRHFYLWKFNSYFQFETFFIKHNHVFFISCCFCFCFQNNNKKTRVDILGLHNFLETDEKCTK
jgi:hypothetical protein